MPPKSKRVAMQEQNKNKKVLQWQWQHKDSTCYYGYSSLVSSDKIASFDMDSTLVVTKTGAIFSKDAEDWLYWNQSVPKRMRQLEKQGYKLVIFTNQMGVQKGKTKLEHIQRKIEALAADMEVQLTAIIACSDDKYRKPGTAMWDLHEEAANGGKKVDKKKSFFCGDAAGRKDAKHKDFSDADLKFAANVGVNFQVPETTFLGEKQQKIEIKGFNPKAIPDEGNIIEGQEKNEVNFVKGEMVIFCGSPGAGKSTFWKNYMPQYSRVNRDTLKTKEKCYKVAEEQIKKGNSVIIDNTNPKKEDRKFFVELAKKYDYKVRCFLFKTSKDVCFHNDYQRVANLKREHLSGKAGSIPIHSWFKYLEEPTLGEGFYQINKVNFIAKFNGEEDKEAYHTFSKK